MRLLIGLILLAFPVAEIWILLALGEEYGWWVLVYLMGIGMLGLRLIREEKALFTGRMMQTLSAGNHPIKAVFGSARNIIAGVLLIIPGVITDMIAVILLLVPIKQHQAPNAQSSPYQSGQAANDDVIEGEFRRED